MRIQASVYESPIGKLLISGSENYITSILFMQSLKRPFNGQEPLQNKVDEFPIIYRCKEQLQEYFNGTRIGFDVALQQEGSAFQQAVWKALLDIPYGRTISYLELSKRIGNVKAIRAVGTTNGKNNISIIVPCHRVIGSNGDLTGYGGDLWRKKLLLDHENKHFNGVQTLF